MGIILGIDKDKRKKLHRKFNFGHSNQNSRQTVHYFVKSLHSIKNNKNFKGGV